MPVRSGIRFLAAWGMFLLLPGTLATGTLAASPTNTLAISADIQPGRITLGQSARLVVSLSGVDSSAQPRFPQVNGLRFQPVGRSSQIRVIEGVSTSALNFSYRVSADRPGEFEIPGIVLHAAGRTIRTERLTLSVVPSERRMIDQGITPVASGGKPSLDPAVTERPEVPPTGRSDHPEVDGRELTVQPVTTPGTRKSNNPPPALSGHPIHVKVLAGLLLTLLVALSVLLFARHRRARNL